MDKEALPGESALAPTKRRRRYSAAFKTQIIAECNRAEASVAGVAIRHGLNPNMVQKWRRGQRRAAQHDFIRLPAPACPSPDVAAPAKAQAQPATVCMEVPTPAGNVIVHWPIDALAQSVDWLRAVTR